MVALLQEPLAGGDTSPSWLEYVAIGLASLSFLVSSVLGLLNRRTAQRALRISERQEARREVHLVLHLNDSVAWTGPSSASGDRLLGFHLLVANPTDRPSSLVSAELRVTFAVDGTVTTVKVPPISHPASGVLPEGVVPVTLPAKLDANSAVAGWFLFMVGKGLTGGLPVDRYDVGVRDIHNVTESLQVTVFREVSYD